MVLEGLAIGSAIAGLGASIYNGIRQSRENDITREREDTAIQRRMQDLMKAGLSPTLAAGSAATTTNTTAPQLSGLDKSLQLAGDLMALRQGKANVSHTNAQTELSKMQATSELFHQGVMQSQKAGMDLQNAWIDSDMASKLKLRGLQGDKISSEIGQITANTALLKAKTAYEQVNKDYLMTAIDNAKIQRDMNIISRDWLNYEKGADVWNKMTNSKFNPMTILGGIGATSSIIEKNFPNLSFDKSRKQWYYPQ